MVRRNKLAVCILSAVLAVLSSTQVRSEPHVPTAGARAGEPNEPFACNLEDYEQRALVWTKTQDIGARLFVGTSALTHQHDDLVHSEALKTFKPELGKFAAALKNIIESTLAYENSSSSDGEGTPSAYSVTGVVSSLMGSASLGFGARPEFAPPINQSKLRMAGATAGPIFFAAVHSSRPLYRELFKRATSGMPLTINEKKMLMNQINISSSEASDLLGKLFDWDANQKQKLGRALAEVSVKSFFREITIHDKPKPVPSGDRSHPVKYEYIEDNLRIQPLDIVQIMKDAGLTKPQELKALEDFAQLLKSIQEIKRTQSETELKNSLTRHSTLEASIQKIVDFRKAIQKLRLDVNSEGDFKLVLDKLLAESQEAIDSIRLLCELGALEGKKP